MKNKHLFYLPAAALLAGYETVSAKDKPNIVLVFVDDMGYGDIGCYGGIGYNTPTLDSLAASGMKFTNFYSAQAVSSASRAGLMTGCYPNRIGISGALSPFAENGIHQDEKTIGELLKEQGYATGIFGKWHLGHHRQFLPLQNGFDEYFGLPYSNDMWPYGYDGAKPDSTKRRSNYPPLKLIEGNEQVEEINSLEAQSMLTTRYTEKAVDFISRNKNKPFFLYLPHSMPHVPISVSNKFKGKSQQGLYGDVMMEIDWSVKQIVETLKKNGLINNTLIIFTSDNGPWINFGNCAGSTGGLREGKGTSFEGGQRVPCIMNWPAVIPKGKTCNKLTSTIDIFPTLAEITGGKLPEHKIDGISILSLIKGDFSVSLRKQFLYYYNNNDLEAVRNEQWKLVFPHTHRTYIGCIPGKDNMPGPTGKDSTQLALYDLRRDPGERYNLAKEHTEVVEELLKIAEQARKDLGDDLTGNKGNNRRQCGMIR
jgi:arylsulfatase A-like enzyme